MWLSVSRHGHRRDKTLRLDRQDRAVHLLKNPLGSVANEESRDSGPANRTHDNQIDLFLVGQLGNHRRRFALPKMDAMLQVRQIILPKKSIQRRSGACPELSRNQLCQLVSGHAATITQELFSEHCPSMDDVKFTLLQLRERGRQVHNGAVQCSLLSSSGSVSTAAKIRA